ncbi:MAG TPA: glycosyltransferase family 2 protein [bacterium]|nr:glycosyltransferase family 2 protein [bacterium]
MTKDARPSVLAGFVNWNQKDDSIACLKLLREAECSSYELQLAVVDNASTDGSAEALRSAFPGMTLLANSSNHGAAGGRNDLFKHFLNTDTDYLMILDPDVSITPGFFGYLLEEINRAPEIGAIGVKAYYAGRPDTFWMKGGGHYNPWTGSFERTGRQEKDRGQYERTGEVDAIPAGFTFVRREVIQKVPKMDERYFIYFEESDWNFKIKRAGWRLVTSEKAKVLHKVSSSLGMESPFFYYYRTRNNLLFVVKNSPFYCWPVFFLYYFCYRIPDTLYMLWRGGRRHQARAVLLGILDFFRGRFYACSHQF